MRKFSLSSNAIFSGYIEVLYGEGGNLVRIDFSAANGLKTGGIDQLITKIIPPHVGKLEERLKQFQTITAIEDEYVVTVQDFMREYPYKRNTHLIPAIWEKMTKTDQLKAVEAAKEYRRFLERNSWTSPRIPVLWLKNKEYLNDWKKL